MKTSYLDLDGRWAVVLVYDYDVNYEYDDIANIIESFGVSPKQTRRSLEILAAPIGYKTTSAKSLIAKHRDKSKLVFGFLWKTKMIEPTQ